MKWVGFEFNCKIIFDSNYVVQGDEKVSVHLMITLQKVTNNVQNISRHSLDIY